MGISLALTTTVGETIYEVVSTLGDLREDLNRAKRTDAGKYLEIDSEDYAEWADFIRNEAEKASEE